MVDGNITRRTCLAGLAGLGAAMALSVGKSAPRAIAAESAATIPLGFSLYGMKTLSLADGLRVCGEIGYDGVELALMPDWPADPEKLSATARTEVRQQLQEHRLLLLALMENLTLLAPDQGHAANLERLKRAAELGHDLAPDSVPVIETVLGGSPPQWDSLKEPMAERLLDWAKVAEAAGVTLAVKPHVRNALHTPEGAVWLMDKLRSPHLRLAYDFSHLQLQKFPLKESLESMLPLSAFIHVKDARGTADKFEFLLPGETGTPDYAAYLRDVQRLGYRGSVVVEVSGMVSSQPKYDPVAAAKLCYEKLSPAWTAAGVGRTRSGMK